jgi:hypothetical protein
MYRTPESSAACIHIQSNEISLILSKKEKNEVMYQISSFTASEEDCPETCILVLILNFENSLIWVLF